MITYNIQGQDIFKTVSPPTLKFDEQEFKKELEALMRKRRIKTLAASVIGDEDAPEGTHT